MNSVRRSMCLGAVALLVSSAVAILAAAPAAADCNADDNWLPQTPTPTFEKPPPHPEPDCGFYRPAWQNFLQVTQPQANGPAFLSFPTIASVFGDKAAFRFAPAKPGVLSLAPRALQGSNDARTDPPSVSARTSAAEINAGVRQAGLNGLLIDQNGQPIYYAIHMNDAFANFIRNNGLITKLAVQNAPANLQFTKGIVELKSSWQIVDTANPPDNYITVPASAPMLKQVGNKIEVDTSVDPRPVTVALLSLHVVFVLDGHPEFIWATFEHVDSNGVRDVAPAASGLPSGNDGLPNGVDGPVSNRSYTLYKAGTLASAANVLLSDDALVAAFDPTTQRFNKGGSALQTSIYRMFPVSKLLPPVAEDQDIVDLNQSMTRLFAGTPTDKRRNYRLVGAVWLDRPERDFAVGKRFRNPPGVSPDDPTAVLAGEDGLSSMAMESFTQNSFVNCFSCHDTRRVTNLDGSVTLLEAKMLNVSHILSKFVSEAP